MKRALIIVGLFLAGCSVDPSANPGQRCTGDLDCPAGRVCYRDFCILGTTPPQDGGNPDTGRDVGPSDTGPDVGPTDIGPVDADPTDTGPDSGPMDTGPCTPGDPCLTGMPGICEVGQSTCGGTVACLPRTSSRAETCNELDDDCDGMEDEDFDLSTDVLNCGRCNAPCGGGLDCCNGRCTNTATSATDCGTCNFPCGSDTCCDGQCFDTTTSLLHCGSCGESCTANEVCCGADGCADTRSDPDHCGSCTPPMSCSGANPLCCGGICEDINSNACQNCAQTCMGGLECCQGACVDKTSDPAFCGACNIACGGATPQCCDSACVANDTTNCNGCDPCQANELCCTSGCVPDGVANCHACGNACGGGQTCCPSLPPATACKFLLVDTQNCGVCGRFCGAGQSCQSGNCCDPGETFCSGMCRNLLEDDRNCLTCGHDCTLLGLFHCNNGACGL